MRIVIEADAGRAAAFVAARVERLLAVRPDAVLGVATGRTMGALYVALAARVAAGALSLARARAFALDEYLGAAPHDAWSFRAELERVLVAVTDLPADALAVPRGDAPDPVAESARYERALAQAGGVDLQLLGLGRNGHLGFNEPGSSLASRTRVKTLARQTREANRAQLAGLHAPPRAAITMGLGTIRDARACVLLATGAHKAPAAAAAIEGPLSASCPASVLQLHRDAILVLDEDAAAGLCRADEYHHAEAMQRELERGHAAP